MSIENNEQLLPNIRDTVSVGFKEHRKRTLAETAIGITSYGYAGLEGIVLDDEGKAAIAMVLSVIILTATIVDGYFGGRKALRNGSGLQSS